MIKQLKMGMSMTAEDTQKAPHVWFSKTSEKLQYTLMLLDPDAGESSPFLHWAVVNIDNQKPASDVDNPEHQYATYIPPSPPPGTGAHRYVFGVFEQSQLNQTFTPTRQESREQFDIDAFAKQNGLNLVGALYMTQGSA
ncbi:phosphatidylethanolamine-binding protein [Fennellomyces sp. T-0311]|nr:phosphatidylethanolamine-binding protein [Fennellomyces sp. T-0311]